MTARLSAALCAALLFCAPAFAQTPAPVAPPTPVAPPPSGVAAPPAAHRARDACLQETASLRGTPGYHDAIHQCMRTAADHCRAAGVAAGTPREGLHAYVESCLAN